MNFHKVRHRALFGTAFLRSQPKLEVTHKEKHNLSLRALRKMEERILKKSEVATELFYIYIYIYIYISPPQLSTFFGGQVKDFRV